MEIYIQLKEHLQILHGATILDGYLFIRSFVHSTNLFEGLLLSCYGSLTGQAFLQTQI